MGIAMKALECGTNIHSGSPRNVEQSNKQADGMIYRCLSDSILMGCREINNTR